MKAQKIVAIFALFGIASLLFHSCNDDDNPKIRKQSQWQSQLQ